MYLKESRRDRKRIFHLPEVSQVATMAMVGPG